MVKTKRSKIKLLSIISMLSLLFVVLAPVMGAGQGDLKADVPELAPLLDVTLSPGDTAGTTSATVTGHIYHSLVVDITEAEIATPYVGDPAPTTGDNLITGYQSGADITAGVAAGKYLQVYAVDMEYPARIVGFYQARLTEGDIKAADMEEEPVEDQMMFNMGNPATSVKNLSDGEENQHMGTNVAAATGVWNGIIPAPNAGATFSGGSGSQGDPYKISTAADLAQLSANVNIGQGYEGKYFQMTADIVLNADTSNYTNWGTASPGNTWRPIGKSIDQPFKGTFDGDGHTVSGIYINATGSDYQGLFGYVDNGTVQNLGVKDSYIKGNRFVGGVVGWLSTVDEKEDLSGDLVYAKVENCYNTGSVSGSEYVGGVLGYIYSGTLKNCYNIGNVIGSVNDTGNNTTSGVVGGAESWAIVTGCYYDNQMCPVGGIGGVDSGGRAEGKLTSQMTTATAFTSWSSGDTGIWNFTSGLYPRLTGYVDASTDYKMDETDAALVSVSPVFLADTDTANAVQADFTLSTANDVSWTSSDPAVISVSGSNATLARMGDTFLTANREGICKSIKLTVTALPTYEITLSQTGTHTFTEQTVGYTPVEPITVTVTRIGTGNITNLHAALSGAASGDFTLGVLSAETLNDTTPSATFTVKPNDSLAPGTYLATVTVTADNDVSQSFDLSFTVNSPPPAVPGAPTGVTATAGNGQATVSFTPPVDDGGSPITGYTVTSTTGNITASVNSGPITVTGLTNGTTYTFTVTATNAAGTGPALAPSNAVTPSRPSSGGSGGGSGGSSTPSTPATPEQPTNNGVDILINGKTVTAATVTTSQEGDRTVTNIIVDDNKLEEKLAQEGNNAVVTIPVSNGADVVIGTLNGQTVKNMEMTDSVLELTTGQVTYTIPASQINIDAVSQQMGREVELRDITVSVRISEPPADTIRIIEDTANQNHYQIVVPPIEFAITCTSGDKTVNVTKFNAYVERLVAIPEGIDPSRITTGVIVNPDGTFSHVPTVITVIDGKYYAKINSLTNSIYTVIYSPKSFKDVETHWAREAINDMASRLVVSGVEKNRFEPDRAVTRAEFAALLVRGLGLVRPGVGQDRFNDVIRQNWHYDAVTIASDYGLISGYGNGKFGPNDAITREQAMAMIARAMQVTKLEVNTSQEETSTILAGYNDAGTAADYARPGIAACVKTGLISGRGQNTLAPKDNITRAEVALIVQKLLQKSGLI